jgi:hypothetical protein
LALVGKYVGNVEDEIHLDIGFSGRLGLFSCLASVTHAINPSRTQLAIGKSLLPQLVLFWQHAQPYLGETSLPAAMAMEAFPWLAECATAVRRKVAQDLEVQVRIMASVNKVPRACRFVPHADYFKPQMPDLVDSLFHSVAMIDILPHIEQLDPVFSEIRRVLRRDGCAILSYFPFAQDGASSARYRCVDEILLGLADEFGIQPEAVYNKQKHEVYPRAVGDVVRITSPSKYGQLVTRYWLDLPRFKLQSPEQILRTLEAVGLRVTEHADVPGGMYKAARKAVVLTKD